MAHEIQESWPTPRWIEEIPGLDHAQKRAVYAQWYAIARNHSRWREVCANRADNGITIHVDDCDTWWMITYESCGSTWSASDDEKDDAFEDAVRYALGWIEGVNAEQKKRDGENTRKGG